MTHPASGNPTWQDYPNTSTLVTAASLEAMEGVLDTVPGKAPRSFPVCESRLTADFGSNAFAGNTYYSMRSQMAPPSGMDPFGMWSLQSGTNGRYVMTVPSGWAGRYDIDWTIYSSGVTSSLLANILLNCPSTTADTGIAGSIAAREGGFGVPTTCSTSIVLAAGDTIAFAVYAQQNGSVTWTMLATLPGTIARSKVVMRYRGPA